MKRFAWLFTLLSILSLGIAACGNEDHVNVFYATFTADEQPMQYTTTVGFFKMGDYAISYNKDRNNPVIGKDYLQIDLPADVQANDVFTEASNRVMLLYQDAEGNSYDSRYNGSTLEITMTAWQGVGGYAEGSFAATLIDDNGHIAVLMDGVFEGFIHN